MKISIVTVCFNSARTIAKSLSSVRDQTYGNIEHLIIDGKSDDNTIDIIRNYEHIATIVSEKDEGIYDAMNKGIKLATGDVVGILNSDDFFTSHTVIEEIASEFRNKNIDALYADVQFVSDRNQHKVVRYYSSKSWNIERFKYGFMPAHPSFYVKSNLFTQLGYYKTDYQIAADFDLLLRFFTKGDLKYSYLPKPIVTMLTGGASTKSLKSKYILSKEVLRSCRENSIRSNWFNMLYRLLFKASEIIIPRR